ncbi:hypothetical protein MNBD_GAMMA26-1427 [hydrothermal vent metagenome]|uniref:Uncharacterized protein n=1 Tax=hydrothermal vent metagenome TaxID=652676 RepID=A0A3B1AZB8_9ZZZZ
MEKVEPEMRFHLYCQGQLLPGAREEKSVRKIGKIINRTEDEVKGQILIGEPRKITSSNDETLINRLYCSLRKAGLDVEIIQRADESVRPLDVTIRRVDVDELLTDPDVFPIQPIDYSQKRVIVIAIAVMLLVMGFVWYWL